MAGKKQTAARKMEMVRKGKSADVTRRTKPRATRKPSKR